MFSKGLVMDKTPNLQLPYLLASQAQKHVTVNESLRILDTVIQIAVASRDLTDPPPTPDDGERHIVADGAAGGWAGQDRRLASRIDGSWMFHTPASGWIAWVDSEKAAVVFNGSAWVNLSEAAEGGETGINQAAMIGINSTADSYNRLSAKTDGILLSHDDVTPGSGDLRVVLNKAAPANTVSLIFQSAFSGRAEFGLAGEDGWGIKVSEDGVTWRQALYVDPASGSVDLPNTPASPGGGRQLLLGQRTYFVRQDGNDANDGLSDDASGAFASIQAAVNEAFGAIDLNGHDVTIQIGAGTYAEDVVAAAPQVGAGRIILSGNSADPSGVVIAADQATITARGPGVRLTVRGLTSVSAGRACWLVERGGQLEAEGANEFGPTGQHHMHADALSGIFVNASTVLAAGAPGAHLHAINGGAIDIRNGSWEIVGAPDFAYFAYAKNGGAILAADNNFSGSATGMRYYAEYNGTIDTNSGQENYFPGNANGDTFRGGRYL